MNASQKTIDANYTAFRKVLPEIMQRQAGRFALMRNEQIVDFFDTASDAVTAGGHLYEDGEFSVQEVMRAPINLGYFSYFRSATASTHFFSSLHKHDGGCRAGVAHFVEGGG